MSKEADKELVDSAGSQRSRRRRKKSGLRIPSDNVPRQPTARVITSSDDGEDSAELADVPDDRDDDQERAPTTDWNGNSGSRPGHDGARVATPEPLEPPAPIDEGDSRLGASAEPSHPAPAGTAIPREPTGQIRRPPSDGEVLATIDDDPDIQYPAPFSAEGTGERSPLHGDHTPPPLEMPAMEDENTEFVPADSFAAESPKTHEDAPPVLSAEEAEIDLPLIDAGSEDDDDLETRKTREMPAVNLEALGLLEFTVDTPGEETSDAEIPIDTADIPLDTDDIPIDEGELEDESVQTSSRRAQRAATVALSDEDLEELIEPMDMGEARRAARAKAADQSVEIQIDARITQPLPIYDPDVEIEDAPPEPAPAPRKLKRPPEPGVPAAVAALESGGMESPLDTPLQFGDPASESLRDAGDSGEILADELIEEVDDSDVHLDADGGRPAPPPAPRGQGVAKKPPPSPRQSHKTGEAPKLARQKRPWFEEIFDEDYLRTLPFLTPQATQAEAVFVASALDAEPGHQLLDIGCGYGRHAMELAARGYSIVALDLSLPLLLRGADEAQRRGLNINFVHGDMREMSFEATFDGAYCLFSTFGYFDDETNKKTVQGIARALKPGGRLVVEVLNRDYLITELPTRVWWEGDGCVVLEEVDFNYFSSRIVSSRSVVFDDGRQVEQEISLRCYSLHEFGKLLHAAGFRVIEVSGSMATRGRFFGNQSRAIIVVAEKPRTQGGKEAGQATPTIPPG